VRSKGNRRFWAGTIAIFLLLLQLFPIAVMANGMSIEPPKYDAPEYKNPGVKAPEWEQPNIQAPTWEKPNVQSPDWGNLGTTPPQYQAPELNAPQQNPNIEAPDLQTPKVEPTTGNVKVDPVKPDPVKNEPFLESTGYDALKYSFKDIMGGTISYSAELIGAGEVDTATALRGKSIFYAGIGIKGLDLFLKDVDGWGTATGLAVDALDLKSGYDALTFVFQQTPNSKLAPFVNSFTSFSNMTPPSYPGLFKGLNVGAAGISLVFDGLDTFNNFKMAFDSSLSNPEQNVKFLDGVSSFGNVLMDAGVIASVIPALQPIAGGLFVAGAALWLLGRAVKYTDKLSGGAITEKIRTGIEKTFNWVKSLFA